MPQQRLITIILTDQALKSRFNAYEMEVPFKYAEGLVKDGKAVFKGGTQSNANNSSLKQITKTINQKIRIPPVKQRYHEIIWLQDAERVGGAELSNQLVVKVGKILGFDICVMTPQNFDCLLLRHAKLIVINNIWHFDINQMNAINRAIFEWLVPYVKYDHDIRDSDQRIKYARRLFKHSKANFFISPAHKKKVQSKVFEMSESHVLPLAIDTNVFKPVKGIERQKGLFVSTAGRLHNSKQPLGLLKFINSHPEYQYEIYIEPSHLINQLFSGKPNITMKLPVKNEELPKVYSKAETLVHLSSIFGAGERVIFEAALCGCKVISNENSGHMSWYYSSPNGDIWDSDLREHLRKAPYEFWKIVENDIHL